MECDAKNLVRQFVTNIPLQNISVSQDCVEKWFCS